MEMSRKARHDVLLLEVIDNLIHHCRIDYIYKIAGAMFTNILYALLIYIVLSAPLFANNTDHMLWKCSAIDNTGMQWSGLGRYPRSAELKAYEGCKKESNNPWECYTARELCEVYSDGESRVSYWRCTAFDKAGGTWKSGPYGNRGNAAKGAMSYCEHFSKKPDTCFLHFVTCKKGN